ncbi:hypothetical protein [Streptomyces sp. NPDC006552]|uniref:hypothetical protein n=1 Tax=Streptomyces sp. NPDC006552 TaxID=3157179 RepID=UPI0033BB94D1
MDLATLKKLKPAEYEQAADGYRAVGDMACAAKDEIDNVVAAGMRKALKGQALDAALRELKQLSANFHYTQIECGLVSTALNGFAHDMDAAKKKLQSALDDAESRKLTVNADGSVTYPEGQPRNGVELPPKGGTVSGATDPTTQAMGRQECGACPPHPPLATASASRTRSAPYSVGPGRGSAAPGTIASGPRLPALRSARRGCEDARHVRGWGEQRGTGADSPFRVRHVRGEDSARRRQDAPWSGAQRRNAGHHAIGTDRLTGAW